MGIQIESQEKSHKPRRCYSAITWGSTTKRPGLRGTPDTRSEASLAMVGSGSLDSPCRSLGQLKTSVLTPGAQPPQAQWHDSTCLWAPLLLPSWTRRVWRAVSLSPYRRPPPLLPHVILEEGE